MRGPPAGPRVLLRRLREVMAEPISAQARLDKIVTQIAGNMVAEVCSAYVLRSDGVLELFATEGLKREAVHHASLRIGEGLVGTIAKEALPLNLNDAQSHPAFQYLPETGEEIYSSFLGVPILRAGRTLGVLVVQNRAHRTYHEEEVEALQTTAMVLAEMIAVGELSSLGRPGTSLDLKRPIMLTGVGLGDGVGGLNVPIQRTPQSATEEPFGTGDLLTEGFGLFVATGLVHAVKKKRPTQTLANTRYFGILLLNHKLQG